MIGLGPDKNEETQSAISNLGRDLTWRQNNVLQKSQRIKTSKYVPFTVHPVKHQNIGLRKWTKYQQQPRQCHKLIHSTDEKFHNEICIFRFIKYTTTGSHFDIKLDHMTPPPPP